MAKRRKVETEQRPLFVHADGKACSDGYVSSVWSTEFGTGATIARTMMHAVFGGQGEAGLAKAMVLCDQYSEQTAQKYRGASVHQRLMAQAQDGLADEFAEIS